MQRRQLIQAAGALPVLSFATLAARTAFAFDGPELYAGEKALYAEAQKEGDILRGEGEGERNRIFADAFARDPGFFEFYRSMQAYGQSMSGSDTTMVLSPDSAFFRFFKGGAGR